jgi:hypothetical protein
MCAADAYWFGDVRQAFTSESTDSDQTAPGDNTEGVPGVSDLPWPQRPGLAVDVGGGKFDGVTRWMSQHHPLLEFHAIDPFRRRRDHNVAVQRIVEARGGADVVTSISVLNVIQDAPSRLRHIRLLHRILRPGGVAYLKVWPGSGSGTGEIDAERRSFQANRRAATFLAEVGTVFGTNQTSCDDSLNLICAIKI